jgi:hypothetical protein
MKDGPLPHGICVEPFDAGKKHALVLVAFAKTEYL